MEEVWKDIKGYEGLYQVSNLGRIKSIPRHGTRKNIHIISQRHNKCGYKIVNLYKNAKGKAKTVHRIVAETFIENPLSKEDINHIDGNKENNNVTNLEWTSHKENMRHARKNNLIKISNKVIEQGRKIGKTRAKKVAQINNCNRTIKEWNSITEANRATGISISNISLCCTGKKEQAGGYKWKFIK
ncbi:MAG: NUMOD4 domain-containing protein [Clostridia bacterium]